jgi:uncharacterized protein YmfQ (DUF2313 family)
MFETLFRQLLPQGIAFKAPTGGWFDTLIRAMSIRFNMAYRDSLATLDAILPDNDNFTTEDATDWERRLGMIPSTAPLADRKEAIRRKMNHPGTIPARQHYLYVQGQLQAAGFDVYVYENRFDDGMGGLETRTPQFISGVGSQQNQHGQFQHGQRQHGGGWGDKVVNSLDVATDYNFNVGNNLRSTFFIGGSPIGTFANIPANRRVEFRQLILRLKPTQTVAYLLTNYI